MNIRGCFFGSTRLSAQDTAAHQTNEQLGPRTRKTSVLPGRLRDLVDKVTARKQRSAAERLSDKNLDTELANGTLSGRGNRAVRREAAKRRQATDAGMNPPNVPRTSVLPDGPRQAIDTLTARKQSASAARLDDAALRVQLENTALLSGRGVRAVQREAAKRGQAGRWFKASLSKFH